VTVNGRHPVPKTQATESFEEYPHVCLQIKATHRAPSRRLRNLTVQQSRTLWMGVSIPLCRISGFLFRSMVARSSYVYDLQLTKPE